MCSYDYCWPEIFPICFSWKWGLMSFLSSVMQQTSYSIHNSIFTGRQSDSIWHQALRQSRLPFEMQSAGSGSICSRFFQGFSHINALPNMLGLNIEAHIFQRPAYSYIDPAISLDTQDGGIYIPVPFYASRGHVAETSASTRQMTSQR